MGVNVLHQIDHSHPASTELAEDFISASDDLGKRGHGSVFEAAYLQKTFQLSTTAGVA
jgi:hypothetical protein